MRLHRATALLAVVILAGCAYRHRLASSSVETKMPRTWFLVTAPPTQEFPLGDMQAPTSKWQQVTTFDTSAGCDAMLEQAENHLQRPVQCIASDDPRLQESTAMEPKE
jgi:hypothetical protein